MSNTYFQKAESSKSKRFMVIPYRSVPLLLLLCTYKLASDYVTTLGLYSLSGKTSYRKISWSLEAARFGFKLFQSLWNLTGTSAALLPRCLSNFRAIRPMQHPISRLRHFTRFGGKTSYPFVNRGPDSSSNITTEPLQKNIHDCFIWVNIMERQTIWWLHSPTSMIYIQYLMYSYTIYPILVYVMIVPLITINLCIYIHLHASS